MREKKEKNLLKDLTVCEINIEKSTTALKLEKRFNINWSFDEYNHLEPSFHVRAAIENEIVVDPREIVTIPTGLYPQLLNPGFEIEIRSLTSLLWEQGLVQADGITYFPYTFRNEIYILIENKSNEYFKEIIFKGLERFIDYQILQYDDFSKVDVHYVGSIAYYLKDEITKIGMKYNLKTGKFIQRPITGLVDYHKRIILK